MRKRDAEDTPYPKFYHALSKYADALEAQAAEIIEEQRISNERGNFIELTLIPESAALTMQLADRNDEIARLTAVNEALHQAQTYRYIGKNGKPILARDLEDQRDAAEAKVAALTAELELAQAQLDGLPPAKPGLLRERIVEIKSEGEAP
jgi:hypothetical protein